jgi:phosphoribosylglycinamide formyltransferase-1
MGERGMPQLSAQERLDRLTALCLALPETIREDKGQHAAFLVRKKIFAYYLNDHHGDNIVSVCCKVLPGENQHLVNANPRKFYLPAYIASRGWVGLRLDLASVDWREVKELIQASYLQIAPKKLAALVR